MKKVLIAVALLIVGCAKEEVKKEPVKDCNCDRIVRVLPGFDIIGQNGQIHHGGGAITINDCTGEQKKWGNGNGTSEFNKKVGECMTYY